MKLGAGSQKWLKAVHLVFASMWVGGGVTLVGMHLWMDAQTGQELYGINRSMRFVDDFIIIPGAFGSLLTGLIYSAFTNWGFFKHGWIIAKWVINLGGILFGTFFLGPWLNSLGPMADRLGLHALADPTYIHNFTMNTRWGMVQTGTLILAVFLSTLKPWKRLRG
jgi:uncharacterized membrane protein